MRPSTGRGSIRHPSLLSASVVVLLLSACASPRPAVTGVRLGMTGDQVVKEWGNPARTEPPVQNDHGQSEVIWHYAVKPKTPKTGRGVAKEVLTTGGGFFDDPTQDQHFVFHFIDGRLAHWRQVAAAPTAGAEPGEPGAQPGVQPGVQPGQPGAQPGAQPGQPGAQPGQQPPATQPTVNPKKGSG